MVGARVSGIRQSWVYLRKSIPDEENRPKYDLNKMMFSDFRGYKPGCLPPSEKWILGSRMEAPKPMVRQKSKNSGPGERGRGRAAGRERYIDGRENTTTDDEEEGEEERPHGRLTGFHGRDLADVPRGQVLVEGGRTVKH